MTDERSMNVVIDHSEFKYKEATKTIIKSIYLRYFMINKFIIIAEFKSKS
jgi:hypothetical protein